MTGLKILVAVMAVLLVAGFGVLVGGIAMQAKRADAGFGSAEVTLPAGARVVETTASGDRVVLRVALPDGEERLYVLDAASGRTVGTIAIKRAP
ncbi:MAG: DUF6476 family protein [Alphaproteobacteria bacterium]|nr:DUF6476 family protein [Alphaproteobacteria bacterium]